jgi:hypothetical protein
MRRLLLFGLLPGLLAADSWVKYTSGPFELLTDANPRTARETLVEVEEFRHAMGKILGIDDLQMPQTVRILVFKNAKGWTSPGALTEGRDRYALVLDEKTVISPDVFRELTRLFLQSNTSRMPPQFEHGLVEFFSTFSVKGIHITVGAPPPSPDLDWARVHLLVVDPEYYGRIRILLYNLRQGVDDDPAYRNAFGKTPAQVEEQARQHFLDHDVRTTSIDSRPLSEKDFQDRPVSSADVRLARADLLAGEQSAADYQSLLRDHVKIPEAEEGLGLLALQAHRNDDARRHFRAAMDANSSSARCYLEYAKLEPDNAKAFEALRKAAGLNPKLDEPLALMAQRDTDPRMRLAHWKEAAARNPRNPAYWKALAECYTADHNFVEAAKAWREGEQSSTDPAGRERMHQARMGVESQRLDYEEAEKKRQAEEEARELDRLKKQALAEVHALEQKYGENGSNADPNAKVVPWWDGPNPSGKVTGILKQVDCLGKQARLLVEGDDHKSVRLLVADSRVAIVGGGDHAFGCGAQKPRRVTIEYFPKANPRTATAGEVATIEFQ